jgi:fibronectin-binding autotransporter adhesin
MVPIRRCGLSAVVVALALCGAAPALGATHVWVGPPGGEWSKAANWGGSGVPTSGEPGGTVVQFGASSTSTMNIPGLVVDQIQFTGANNTIAGSTALTISGSTLFQNIVSEAAGNTLGATLPVTLAGAPVEAASSAGTLTVAGPVGGATGLVLAGAGGDFALTGNNSYTGPTTIVSGALHITTPVGYVIVGSSLTIGTGAGATAELVLDQSSDISPATPVTVNSNGVFDFQSHIDTAQSLTVNGGRALVGTLTMSGPLVVNEGTVAIEGMLTAGSLNMTGGTVSAAGMYGPGLLALAGDIQATSSPSAPATVASGVRLSSSPTVTVTPGTLAPGAPELRLTGAIGETGGSRGIVKTGAGTMTMSGTNTYTGTTTVSAGTLVAEGSQSGAFAVAQHGTLAGSGTVGATSVAGVLAPTAPGLHTGALSFQATGTLEGTLSSFTPAAIPAVFAAGPVTIDPSAALKLTVAPGMILPRSTSVALIENAGSQAIAGQFSGIPDDFVLSTIEGIPLQLSYTGGDGNDLSLTSGSPPPISASTATSPATPTPPPAPVRPTSSGAAPAPASTTVKSSGYGAVLGVTVPSACVRPGAPFSVTLSVAKRTMSDGNGTKGKGHGKGRALVTVRKVLFAIGRTVRTARGAPFRAQLTLPSTATSGSTVKLLAKAYLEIPGGPPRTKSIAVSVKVC